MLLVEILVFFVGVVPIFLGIFAWRMMRDDDDINGGDPPPPPPVDPPLPVDPPQFGKRIDRSSIQAPNRTRAIGRREKLFH